MIGNEQEYRVALQRMEADRTFAQQQRAALEAMGLPLTRRNAIKSAPVKEVDVAPVRVEGACASVW